jgi:hypothetical protein
MPDRTSLDDMIALYESNGIPTPEEEREGWFAMKGRYVEFLRNLQNRMGTLNRLTGFEMDDINDRLETLLSNLEELPNYE